MVAARPWRAHRQVPPRHSRRLGPLHDHLDLDGAEPGIDRLAGDHHLGTAAEGLGVSPLEVALAWVRDRPGVVAPILGARTAAQLRGALTVEDLTLPDEIVSALDEVSAPERGYPDSGWNQR